MRLKDRDVLRQVPGLTARRLKDWIERGWVVPAQSESGPVFDDIDVARADLIRQLRDDLAVDRDTVPVLLSLMDQVYTLRHELRCVMRALDDQPVEVREKIVARVKIHRGGEAPES